MKKLILSTIASLVGLLALNANAVTLSNSGPLTISWRFYQQGVETNMMSTNHTSKETNIVTKGTEKINTFTFNTADLLSLLAYSFDTNFASNDKLAIDGNGKVWVVDKTGTNVVLDPSSVLSLNFNNTVSAGIDSETQTTKQTGAGANVMVTNLLSGTGSRSETGFVYLSYDDSSLLTNYVTTFDIGGLGTSAIDKNFGTDKGTESVTVSAGAGYGTLYGTNSVISGSITGSAKGADEDD